MRETWGCEDLFLKKNKSSNGSLFEAFHNREMHVVFKRHEPWTMRNRKEQFITRSAKRIEVIPGIRKKNCEMGFPLLLSHPPLWNALSFLFPQIRKSSTCSPVPAPYNRLRVALSPPSHFQPPSGGSRKQKRRRKKKNKNKNPPMPLAEGVYIPVYLFIYFDTLLLMCFWNKNKIKIDSHFYIK